MLFAGMVPGTFVMDIAKGPFNRIGPGTVGRQVEQLEARMSREPLLDFLGVMNLGIIGDHGELSKEGRGVGPIERCKQVEEEARLLAIPHTMRDSPGGQIQRPSQVAFLIGARRHDFHLFPFGHPLLSDLRQQIDIQLVGKE